jgi:hypothetical protein
MGDTIAGSGLPTIEPTDLGETPEPEVPEPIPT